MLSICDCKLSIDANKPDAVSVPPLDELPTEDESVLILFAIAAAPV
jgi:hypothetical protein